MAADAFDALADLVRVAATAPDDRPAEQMTQAPPADAPGADSGGDRREAAAGGGPDAAEPEADENSKAEAAAVAKASAIKAAVAWLKTLEDPDYLARRVGEARKLHIRVGDLDRLVKDARKWDATDDSVPDDAPNRGRADAAGSTATAGQNWIDATDAPAPDGAAESSRVDAAGSGRTDGQNWIDPTEDAVALAFAAERNGRYVHDHTSGAWHIWQDNRWARDLRASVFNAVRDFTRVVHAGLEDPLPAMAKIAFAAAVERAARADPRLAVSQEVWDTDPWLLGVPGGVVDLRTGETREAAPDLYISRQTSVAPAATADCPLWRAFLDQATGNDKEMAGYLKRWFGYCLTGDTREHALLFVYGPGGNGKGVLLNTVSGILGEYAVTAAMDTFTASHGDRHPTDLAMLRGARLVLATETEEGRAWAEARIKALTGGDPITARFMRQDFFTFQPAFKPTISGNHKPALRNVDDAARRRFNIAPFVHKPAVPDKTLPEKLKAEWPGILRWLIEGCLEWQRDGLKPPKIVADATTEYFKEQDILRQWIEDCCETTTAPPHASDTNASLLASWRSYALAHGEEPGSSKWFSTEMQRQGFVPIKDSDGIRGRGLKGIAVKIERGRDRTGEREYDGCKDE